jgi:carbon storage regulator CsrA
MLVLSRRAEQQLVFPNLGITVKVLQVRGRLVKIGIEAPRDVKILRSESSGTDDAHQESAGEAEHALRNQLHLLQLKILNLQSRLQRGHDVDAGQALDGLLETTNQLDQRLSPDGAAALPDAAGRAQRLLVVEDSDNERRLMAYLLASRGFDVDVARDGSEALYQLRSGMKRPHTVLMDMQMPLCNGLETLQQIREDHQLCNLRVYAVTGSQRAPNAEPMGRGWDGWFQKPLDVQALLAQLRSDIGADAQATQNAEHGDGPEHVVIRQTSD